MGSKMVLHERRLAKDSDAFAGAEEAAVLWITYDARFLSSDYPKIMSSTEWLSVTKDEGGKF